MDASFSLVLHSTTKITLNERFSNLETTCQKVDDDLRSVRVVSSAAGRFEASKNQRLALQMANRMCFKDSSRVTLDNVSSAAEIFEASKNQRLVLQMANRMHFKDDSRVTLDNVLDDSFAEVARCSSRKSIAQRLSHVPERLTEVRPSAKSRLTVPAAAAVAAGRQRPVRPGFANVLHTLTVDGAVAGLKTRKRMKARKKRVVSAPLESSRVFSTLDKVQGHLDANNAGSNAVSKPANGLNTSSHIQTAVAKFKTVAGRRRRRKAKTLGVGGEPAQSTQHKPSDKQSASFGSEGEGRALLSPARGRRSSRGVVGKVAPDTAALDRELDDYMSHAAKLALA